MGFDPNINCDCTSSLPPVLSSDLTLAAANAGMNLQGNAKMPRVPKAKSTRTSRIAGTALAHWIRKLHQTLLDNADVLAAAELCD